MHDGAHDSMTHLQFKCNVSNRFRHQSTESQPAAAQRSPAPGSPVSVWLYLGLETEITVDMKCMHNSQFTSKPGPGPGLRHDPCTGWPDQPGGEVFWNFYCLAGVSLCLKLHLDE